MADYYPLISRAVSSLDNNKRDMRRALYERARFALINQLRSFDPPLNESDITRELSGLEEAIQNVEVEATKRSRSSADEAADRPSHDEPFVAGTRNSALEPSAPSTVGEHRAYAPPVRSYGHLIKIVLLVVIIAGVTGAAYLERKTLAWLMVNYLTISSMDIWDFAIPVVAYGAIALVFSYWLLSLTVSHVSARRRSCDWSVAAWTSRQATDERTDRPSTHGCD